MAKTDVSDLGDAELLEELGRERQELFTLRFKLATGSLETTSKIPQHKRQIARIMTELREREIAAAEAEQEATANG
ncbi:MAG: 50S ribosomal protein L29 [Acidimicrobiales bacterium]